MYGQPSPRKIGNHRQGSTNRDTRHPSTDAAVKVGPVHYEPCDFVVLARSGSCIPGEGSICAVRTTLAPRGDPHSAVTASESVPAYGTTDRPLPRVPVLDGVVACCERPELLLLWRRVGVCGEEGRNGPDSSSTLSRSSCSGDDVRSLSDADACLACERVRVALAALGSERSFLRRAALACATLTSSISCSQSRSSLGLDGVPLLDSRDRREASVGGARIGWPPKRLPVVARTWFAVVWMDEEKTSRTPWRGESVERVNETGSAGREREALPFKNAMDDWEVEGSLSWSSREDVCEDGGK